MMPAPFRVLCDLFYLGRLHEEGICQRLPLARQYKPLGKYQPVWCFMFVSIGSQENPSVLVTVWKGMRRPAGPPLDLIDLFSR